MNALIARLLKKQQRSYQSQVGRAEWQVEFCIEFRPQPYRIWQKSGLNRFRYWNGKPGNINGNESYLSPC